MTLKSKLIEFIVKKDLIPKKLKWEKNVDGIGRLYSSAFSILDSKGKKQLADIMYNWGFQDSDKVAKLLGIKNNLHGCAVALLTANHTFGSKNSIVEEDENKIVMHITSCRWKNQPDWTPALCASVEQYELGLINGIDKNVDYLCSKRRSKGDTVCEVILKNKSIEK